MELWIRSQDKETLRLAEMLDIYDLSDSEGQCWAIEESGTTIGYYKSKKRALEVLDEIQELIKPKIITTQYQCAIEDNKKTEFNLIMNPVKTEIQELSTIVYEMPKE